MSSVVGIYNFSKKKLSCFADAVHEKIVMMIRPPQNKIFMIKSRLAGLSDQMETIMADAEPDFLHLGKELQSIFSTATRLSDIVIHSGRKQGGSEEKILAQISGFANKSVDKLKGCRNEITESLHFLDSEKDNLEKLAGMCLKHEKMSTLLHVIALNIAVESNRTKQSSEMFVIFAQEIKQVAENVKKIAQNLYEDSKATCIHQAKIQSEISTRIHQLTAITQGAEKVVSKAVEKIDRLSVMFENSMKNGVRYSKEISDQVSEIVMAIQFHDIVRQQIEHVILALRDAEKLCHQLPDEESQNVLEKVCAVLQVQVAQIQQVILEMDKADNQITRSFENIEARASNLVACLSESFISRDIHETDQDNPFSSLISSLEDLQLLLNQAYDLKKLMDQAATEASSSIAGLVGHTQKVQEISLDLHRKALNAIIKSAHLGEMGTTFEILAQEVTTVSEESNLFANQVIRIIDSVSTTADQLKQTDRNRTIKNIKESMQQPFQMEEEITRVKEAYRLFLENTSHASGTSQLLEKSIHETRSSLSFLKLLMDKLTISLKEAETILEDLEPWKSDEKNQTADILDSSKRYTMESERAIHSQIMGRNRKQEPPDALPTAGHESENSIELFDEKEPDSDAVELFEMDSDTLTLDNAKEADASEPVVFFEEETELPGSEKVRKDSTDNSNIELF